MRRILTHGGTATAIAVAALVISLVALLSPGGDSGPDDSGSDRALFALPAQAENTVSFVQRAMGFYDAEGRDATLDLSNSPAGTEGENYLFIVDEDGLVAAHINPDLLGRDLRSDLGVDADGYRFGEVMLGATEAGLWVDYVYLNPVSGYREMKHSWVVRHDGLIFGSGWYEVQSPSPAELE